MNTRNAKTHKTGEDIGLTIDGRPVPYQSGVLPKDFAERLVRLKEASGLTWNAFADALGVDPKLVHRWRNGVEPCGGAMLSICRFASRIPGGLPVILGEGFQMTFFKEES